MKNLIFLITFGFLTLGIGFPISQCYSSGPPQEELAYIDRVVDDSLAMAEMPPTQITDEGLMQSPSLSGLDENTQNTLNSYQFLGINFYGWVAILGVCLELFVRLAPTARDYSLVGILYSALNYIAPNKSSSPGGGKYAIKRE